MSNLCEANSSVVASIFNLQKQVSTQASLCLDCSLLFNEKIQK